MNNKLTILIYDGTGIICEELNKKYSDIGCFEFISNKDWENSNDKTYLDLSDEKLSHLLLKEDEINGIREQIIDGVVATVSGDTLIGIDFSDFQKCIQGCQNVSIATATSEESDSIQNIIQKLILKTNNCYSSLSSVYFYVEGDVALFEINDMVNTLEQEIGENKYMAFTAKYNNSECGAYKVLLMIFN